MDLQTIINKPRMVHDTYDIAINRLFGLDTLIRENLKHDCVMCEVGSYAGVSSALFAYYCKTVYCVDMWYGGYDNYNDAEQIFDETLPKFGNVTKIKDTSARASMGFADNTLDFVYIDASHEYVDVRNDIRAWVDKVKLGGAIGGHDYWYAGVREAVSAEFPLRPLKTYEDTSWIIRL